MGELDEREAKSIQTAKGIIANANLKNDLAFIKCHFSYIPVSFTKLESQGVLLSDAIHTFKSVREKLLAIRRRKEFLEKFDFVYNNNSGLKTLELIGEILAGNNSRSTEPDEFMYDLEPTTPSRNSIL